MKRLAAQFILPSAVLLLAILFDTGVGFAQWPGAQDFSDPESNIPPIGDDSGSQLIEPLVAIPFGSGNRPTTAFDALPPPAPMFRQSVSSLSGSNLGPGAYNDCLAEQTERPSLNISCGSAQ